MAESPLPAPPHGTVYQFGTGGKFPDGQDSQPYDCMVASGMMALDAWSRGALHPTATTLRGLQSDQDRSGIGLNDLAEAFGRLGVAGSWTYGAKLWTTILSRARAGRGLILAGRYLALGAWRASTFQGSHAIYLERIDGSDGIVHDPLRRAAVRIPVAALARFYASGIGQAGWFVGDYAGGAGVGSGTTVSAGGTSTMAEYLGVPPNTIFDAALLERFLSKVRASYGAAGNYGVGYLRMVYEKHLGERAGDIEWKVDAAGQPAGNGLDQLLGDFLKGAQEIVVSGLLLMAILGVIVIALYQLTKEPVGRVAAIAARVPV